VDGSARDEPVETRESRESLILTFEFERHDVVRLASVERVDMIAPASPTAPPEGGRDSGTWVELRSKDDDVLFHRVLHNPFLTVAEHHSPDGGIELVERDIEPDEFEVIVPALPEAARVVVWAAPPQLDRADEPAERVVDEELTFREEA